jgi:hypothetical protein
MRERRSLFSQRVTRVSMVVVLDFPSLVTDGVRFAVVGGGGALGNHVRQVSRSSEAGSCGAQAIRIYKFL